MSVDNIRMKRRLNEQDCVSYNALRAGNSRALQVRAKATGIFTDSEKVGGDSCS